MPQQRCIAIVAGQGDMPLHVARAAIANGHNVYVFPIEGSATADFSNYAYTRLKMGQIGAFFDIAKVQNCTEMVLVGKFQRPELQHVKFDWGAVKRIPDMMALLTGGDNAILERITAFFEGEGMVLRAISEIAPQLLMDTTAIGTPTAAMKADAELGFELLKTIGRFDIGQACIVSSGRILAVEAAEGTDAMITNAADIKGIKGAILVKAPKPKQELRNDMPVIGADTIIRAVHSGLAGIALQAGGVLLAGRHESLDAAKAHKIVLWGR